MFWKSQSDHHPIHHDASNSDSSSDSSSHHHRSLNSQRFSFMTASKWMSHSPNKTITHRDDTKSCGSIPSHKHAHHHHPLHWFSAEEKEGNDGSAQQGYGRTTDVMNSINSGWGAW